MNNNEPSVILTPVDPSVTFKTYGDHSYHTVSMSSDSQYLVSCTNGGGGIGKEHYINIRRLTNANEQLNVVNIFRTNNLPKHTRDAKLSPDNKYLVAVDISGDTRIWDVDKVLNIKKEDVGGGRHTKRRKSKKARRTRRKF